MCEARCLAGFRLIRVLSTNVLNFHFSHTIERYNDPEGSFDSRKKNKLGSMYGNYVVIAESNRGEQMQALKKKQGKSVLREPSRLQKGFILICF